MAHHSRPNSSKSAQARKKAARPFKSLPGDELADQLHATVGSDADEEVWRALRAEEDLRKQFRLPRSASPFSRSKKTARSITTDDIVVDPETGDITQGQIRLIKIRASPRGRYVDAPWLVRGDRAFEVRLTSPSPTAFADDTRGIAWVRRSWDGKWAFGVSFSAPSHSASERVRDYDSGFVFPSAAAATARLKTYLLKVSGRKRAPRDVALPNMASDAVKAWRAEMRAKHGPNWHEIPGIKDSRPGGRVAAKIREGRAERKPRKPKEGSAKTRTPKSSGGGTSLAGNPYYGKNMYGGKYVWAGYEDPYGSIPGADFLFNGLLAFSQVPYMEIRVVGGTEKFGRVKMPPKDMGEFTYVVVGKTLKDKYEVFFYDDEQPWMNVQYHGIPDQKLANAVAERLFATAQLHAVMGQPHEEIFAAAEKYKVKRGA